jgi:hypothetical protein
LAFDLLLEDVDRLAQKGSLFPTAGLKGLKES